MLSSSEPSKDIMSGRLVKPVSSRARAIKDSYKCIRQNGRNSDALDEALVNLQGDVVVLGGYRGSFLYDKRTDRRLWPSITASLNLANVELELGIDAEDENTEDDVYSGTMFSHLGPIDISRRLLKYLRKSYNAKHDVLRIHEYGWDWRLHPNTCSVHLRAFLEGLWCNRNNTDGRHKGAIVIAHSLGGLIVRHAINIQPELFAGVIFVGSPQAAPQILGPLRNGDAVLLSERIFSAQVNFTFRTSFLLLPMNGRLFIDKSTREDILLDYFDCATWIKHRLSPCIDRPVSVPRSSRRPDFTRRPNFLRSCRSSSAQISHDRLRSFEQRSRSTYSGIEGIIENRRPSMARRARSAVVRRIEGVEEEMSFNKGVQPQMTNSAPRKAPQRNITIPREKAIEYLSRVLPEIKQFKLQLEYDTDLEHKYPPLAVILSNDYPTVSGVLVDGAAAIKNEDTYQQLIHERGDGVVLEREAMLPPGYKYAIGGLVRSNRSHTGLLGDFDAVGKALLAIMKKPHLNEAPADT